MGSAHKTKLSYTVDLPLITDEGSLSFAESERHVPFAVKRFYCIFDILPGAIRGMHAHRKTKQMLFCLRGSVDVTLDNGKEKETIRLDQTTRGLLLDAMIWHEMSRFSPDAFLLVVASDYFDEGDYIRNYQQFLREL